MAEPSDRRLLASHRLWDKQDFFLTVSLWIPSDFSLPCQISSLWICKQCCSGESPRNGHSNSNAAPCLLLQLGLADQTPKKRTQRRWVVVPWGKLRQEANCSLIWLTPTRGPQPLSMENRLSNRGNYFLITRLSCAWFKMLLTRNALRSSNITSHQAAMG